MTRFILAIFFVTLIGGCGGGESSGNGAGTITALAPVLSAAFEPKEGQLFLFENQQLLFNTYEDVDSSHATLNVDGIDPKNVFPVIVADKPVFDHLRISVPNLSRKVEFSARPSAQLAAGTHTGTLTVTLYKDAAKTQAYTLSNGGVFPYTIKVAPQMRITVKIDGVTQAYQATNSNAAVVRIDGNNVHWYGSGPESAFRLKPGQMVEMTSSIPVTWHHLSYPYENLWQAPQMTDTTLRLLTPSQPYASMSGATFIAMPKAGSVQWGAGIKVDVR